MKSIIIIIFYILPTLLVNGQGTLKEVDRLYQKYKNTDSITVTNAKGSVKLGVEIKLNSSGKPESIILSGYTSEYAVASSIVDKLENDKLKAGYKYSGETRAFHQESLNLKVYTKGTQYAKYVATQDLWAKNIGPPDAGTEKQKKAYEEAHMFALFGGTYIYLEVGDISRKVNSKGEDFKF